MERVISLRTSEDLDRAVEEVERGIDYGLYSDQYGRAILLLLEDERIDAVLAEFSGSFSERELTN